MLLLSFPSQTSHFWQLGGVTQTKMRSLLRLLVKSIIEDGTRQANAAAARRAHHSASPTADPSEQDAEDTKLRRTRRLTHFRRTDFSIFIATLGLLFFFYQTVGKSTAARVVNVAAVNNNCYLLFLREMFCDRLSVMVLLALSLKTQCLALFIPHLQDQFAADLQSQYHLCSTINNRCSNSDGR